MTAAGLARLAIADEAIGPLVTLVGWLVVLLALRSRSTIEWIAVLGCLVMVQLLLDLLVPHLGDIVIAAVHAGGVVAYVIRKRRTRPARPSALSETDDG